MHRVGTQRKVHSVHTLSIRRKVQVSLCPTDYHWRRGHVVTCLFSRLDLYCRFVRQPVQDQTLMTCNK